VEYGARNFTVIELMKRYLNKNGHFDTRPSLVLFSVTVLSVLLISWCFLFHRSRSKHWRQQLGPDS